MPDRAALLDRFLAGTDWRNAGRRPLAGDASNRRYERLNDPLLGPAVLMDAPPEKGEDVRPFVTVARYLTGRGLAAPRILAEDAENGFLILEDLGDDLYARVVAVHPAQEEALYAAAIDALAHLHEEPAPDWLSPYAPKMPDLAALTHDWYLRGAGRMPDPAARAAFVEEVARALAPHQGDEVTILRDFHAENLIWLPDRDGLQRVGLLDFQDAMSGHRAYDLVSLLEDARRDVSPALAEKMLARYIDRTGQEADRFRAAYAAMGAQRNLRILGVFARLSLRDGKRHYVDLIPRVWAHMMTDLAHPDLTALRQRVLDDLPPPDPEFLDKLRTS
ncbi:MAG: phosphotransferase [Rhodobacteraceae bacterium]|nr:phosphotransferase [Paracoccaceae bacterium]